MVHAGLAFMAEADAVALGAAAQADSLRGLEQASSVMTAARTSILGAFAAGQGYADDGAYSPRAWLVHQTSITVGAASGYTGWVRRARMHPRVHSALAAGEISEPWARVICRWSGKLPNDSQDAADGILLAAAVSGLGLPDLGALAAEMYERSRQHAPDTDSSDSAPGSEPDPGPAEGTGQENGKDQSTTSSLGEDAPSDADARFDDRSVRLATTFGGAGVIRGDLTPECAQVVQAVLDALSARGGAEDTRSHEQRYHDALQEAMTRLVAAGLVPERAGQPVKMLAHITVAELMLLEGSEALRDEWARRMRARWAGYRARSAEVHGDDGVWLDGDAAAAIACDAMVAPVVSGQVNPSVFADLVRLSAALDKIYRRGAAEASRDRSDSADDGPSASTLLSQEALEQAVICKAVELLSGPDGLVSFVRRRQLGPQLGGASLPLDLGVTKTIPAHIRNLVRHRDRHCRFPGCRQPAAVCEVHHIRHKAHGGKTSLDNCVLLCRFHHQIAIHRQGWILVLKPDGTTTAWNKDKTKVLHSHGPPAPAG